MLIPYSKVLHKPLGFINLQNLGLTASDFRVRILYEYRYKTGHAC